MSSLVSVQSMLLGLSKYSVISNKFLKNWLNYKERTNKLVSGRFSPQNETGFQLLKVETESSGWLQSVLVKIYNKLSRLRKGHLLLMLESKQLACIICAIKRGFFQTESAF